MIKNPNLEPYWSLIEKALSSRKATKDAMSWDKDHKAPRYVVAMCEDLVRVLQLGGTDVSLAEIVRLEQTCTGADYTSKLALRCQRLTLSAAA